MMLSLLILVVSQSVTLQALRHNPLNSRPSHHLPAYNDVTSRDQAASLIKTIAKKSGGSNNGPRFGSLSIPVDASMPIVRELDITMATKIPNVLARLKPSTDGKAEQTRNALALLLTFLFSITFINTLSTSSFYVALPMLTRYILTTFFTFLPLGVCFLGLFQYEFLTTALVATSRRILPASRRRVYTHEAGHFLIGYLLGYPPRGYETQTSLLNSVDFFVVDDNLAEKQKRALGFDISQSDELTTNSSNDPKKSWPFRGFSRRQLEDLSLISLGGVCAELLFFQTAHGGNSDFSQLESFFTSASTKLSQPQQRNIKVSEVSER